MEAVKALSAEEITELCLRHTLYDWSAQSGLKPLAVAGASGVHFQSADGRRFLDFNSQLMCVNAGHGDRRIIDAIKRQAEQLAYSSPFMATEVRARLGAKLAELLPGDIDKVFFTLAGADANENAIKIARVVTGRHKILARYRSYHGSTAGAVAATGDPRRWPNEFAGGGGVVHVLDPYHGIERGWDTVEASLAGLEETIQLEGPSTIAAFILEPIPGTNGILVPADGYLQGVRAICDRHGPLVRGRPLGRGARHDHDGQRPHLFLCAAWRCRDAARGRRLLRGPRLLRRADLQQPPARVRGGPGRDPGVRRGRHGRQLAADGRGAVSHPPPAGRAPPVRRRGAFDRAVRVPRAGARPSDAGAACALQRHLAGDEGDRRRAGRRRYAHVRPVEHGHDQPAPVHHRGRARRGLRDPRFSA